MLLAEKDKKVETPKVDPVPPKEAGLALENSIN
jgi:hypothetical protein